GQLFCDGSARQVVDMLLRDLAEAGGELRLGIEVKRVLPGFTVETRDGPLRAKVVVVATGGKSIPKMGATGLGYDIARAFGLDLIEPRPGLVPLTFSDAQRDAIQTLA
ncbi:NAD(P)/FAD-dependent oxidoreductase, partial [Bacillus sp. NTK074B]|nr:NAD(P)/FAD-dependent oxidoreductase [Bacillus sp. NTK074B]